jgi:glycosyltransferase involved in cell wall biosynthesis
MKEAMACGTAVAGARIGGIPEAIKDGENGMLYEPDNAADLSRVLSSLASDAEARRRMGASGRRTAVSKFDARVSADQTLEVFRRVVAFKGKAR